jgi:beta-lactamase class C
MNRFLAALLSLAALVFAPAASAQLSKEAQDLRAFGAELDRVSQAPDFVGLAVTVVKDGNVWMTKTYGVREAGKPDPITPDTVFRVASVSKGFAATLASIEEHEGHFNYSDPIVNAVPAFRMKSKEQTNAITVEDILSHRAGLPPFAYDDLLEAGMAPMEILAKYASVRPSCPVGQCYGYQNSAFNMVANVIERSTGESYVARLKRRIFDPLGMKTASTGSAGLVATGNWARPHVRKGDVWVAAPTKEPYYLLPAAAGVNASITDLGKWLIAQTGNRPDILPTAVLEDLRTPRINTAAETRRQIALKMPVTKSGYGLGWRISTYAGHTLVQHSGSVEGYIAHVAYLPERRTGIALLSNSRGGRAPKIIPMWLDYELGLPKTDWMRLNEIPGFEAASAEPGEENVGTNNR